MDCGGRGRRLRCGRRPRRGRRAIPRLHWQRRGQAASRRVPQGQRSRTETDAPQRDVARVVRRRDSGNNLGDMPGGSNSLGEVA